MSMILRYRLFYIMLLLILSIPSNAQESTTTPTESTASVSVAAGGGCLLGATVGTFIFPGIGSVIGCATASLGSVLWKYLAFQKSDGQ